MNRSGYSDEFGDEFSNQIELYRASVERALAGKRGQKFLKDLLSVLDAMPDKRLVPYALEHNGEVCALGAIARAKEIPVPKGELEDESIDVGSLAHSLGISACMAKEIMFENDKGCIYGVETPERRFTRMYAWVWSHIKLGKQPK